MAKTKDELKTLSNQTFFDNNEWLIQPEGHRNFNNEVIDAMATEDWVKEQVAAVDVSGATFMACRRWHKEQASPVGEVWGKADDIRKLPELLGLGCYMVQDNFSMRKLHPENHRYYADGSGAYLSGEEGQYMWCWNAHYFSSWEAGDYIYWAVSLNPIPGVECQRIPAGGISAFNAGVMNRDNGMLCSVVSDAPYYRGGFNSVDWDSTFLSQLGLPATGMTVKQFQDAAKLRGSGWGAGYRICSRVPRYLFAIIYGTRNSQAPVVTAKDINGLYQGGLGTGFTDFAFTTEWSRFPILPTSACVEAGDACGEGTFTVTRKNGATVDVKIPIFFGFKNMFGSLGTWISGELYDDTTSTVYASLSINDNPSYDTTAGMTPVAVIDLIKSTGFISKLSMKHLAMAPVAVAGSESTYYCDFGGYVSGSIPRAIVAGASYADLTGRAGAFYSLASYTTDSVQPNVTAPLCFLRESIEKTGTSK